MLPAHLPLRWHAVALQKKKEQWDRVREWRLDDLPAPDVTNYLDFPQRCGLLTEEELRITEKYDATALAQAIREGSLKCVDVTRAFCKRAAVAHQLTNCLTEIFFEDALRRAERLDELVSRKEFLGPFHGVPVSIKDTFKVSGYDTSIGLAALACNAAKDDAILVKCLYDAGAVLYCKTNVPQTLMALDTHNNVFGRTTNPCNVAVTAGGSSGGEGALLAMRGSVLGVGTDIAGSIRIPAMCNGTYGIKASWERLPYAGQEDGTPPGLTKVSIPASVGPLAHSVRDLDLFFRAVLEKKPWNRDPDVVPMPWSLPTCSRKQSLRIGIVRTDGLITPHPPIARLLDEVKRSLLNSDLEVVELDVAPLFSQCQRLAQDLFGIEGENTMCDILDAADEPLSPWLVGRFERRKRLDLESICALHSKREQLRQEFLSVWEDESGPIDALICPVAPHPVPPIDQYNGLSYTSSFVLLNYPAGVIPVRTFEHRDTQGDMVASESLGAWDEANRKLWTDFDPSMYIGTPLCVQVVVPTLMEEKLVEVMAIVDTALKGSKTTSTG